MAAADSRIVSFLNSDFNTMRQINDNIVEKYSIADSIKDSIKPCHHEYFMYWAAANNHLDIIVEYLRPDTDTSLLLDIAAEHGHLQLVQWIYNIQSIKSISADACERAVIGGHLDVIKWLYSNNFTINKRITTDYAAKFGHIHILMWLLDNKICAPTSDALEYAADNDHLHVIIWLHKYFNICSYEVLNNAEKKNHFEIIDWININCDNCKNYLNV